jgi:hypothetical protein
VFRAAVFPPPRNASLYGRCTAESFSLCLCAFVVRPKHPDFTRETNRHKEDRGSSLFGVGSCASHRNSKFFMILCALCDSEVLFRNYHVFEYSATNINRRDAEFAETWKFTLLPALEKNSIFMSK